MLDAALSNTRHARKKATSILATKYRNFDGAFSLSIAVQLLAPAPITRTRTAGLATVRQA